MFEAITPHLFTPGRDAKIFLGVPFKGREIPEKKVIELSGGISPGQTAVNVAALPVSLYEGTPLPFPSGTVYVGDFLPQGSTSLVINHHNKTIPGGESCELWAWIPLLSVKTFSIDGQMGELTDNTVSKLETGKAINSISKSVSISGPKIFGDPGMAIINALQNQLKGYKVKAWFIQAMGRGSELLDCYFSKSEQSSNASFDQVSISGVIPSVEAIEPSFTPYYWFYELTGISYGVYNGSIVYSQAFFWGDPALNTGNNEGELVQYLLTPADPEMGKTPWSIQFYSSPPSGDTCNTQYWSISTNGRPPFGWDDAAQCVSGFDWNLCAIAYKAKPTPSRLYRYSGYVPGGAGSSGFGGTGDLRIFAIDTDYLWDAETGSVQWITDPQSP